MKRATAIFLVLALMFLGSIYTWWMAVISWWHHQDHASLGWLMLWLVLNAYLMSQGSKLARIGHRAMDREAQK